VQRQILQSIVYAIRYMNTLTTVAFNRVIVQHVQNQSMVNTSITFSINTNLLTESRTKLPRIPSGNKFGGFFTALNSLPAGTCVDFMVRGWVSDFPVRTS
jgi:hypothetical protein